MATWKECDKIFGKDNVKKMKKCPHLNGITVIIKDGLFDIPLRDLDIAYRWSKGESIYGEEMD